MAEIVKKIPTEFFELIKSGRKRFEVRVADFEVKEGDILILKEFDPHAKKFTGREIRKKVGYILRFPLNLFGQKKLIEKHGLYILQLED